jgi:hypothetical protein
MDPKALAGLQRIHERGLVRHVLVYGLLNFSLVAVSIAAAVHWATSPALDFDDLVEHWWPMLLGLPVFGAALAIAAWYYGERQLSRFRSSSGGQAS